MLRGFKRSIGSLGIIGAGQMGTGVAIVAAYIGNLPVKVLYNSEASVERAKKDIASYIRRKSKDDVEKVLSKITYTKNLQEFNECDLMLEAIPENFSMKKNLIETVSPYLKDDCIFATNTSSLSVTKLASTYKIPENVVGIHFFIPVTDTALLELVKALQTSETALEKGREFATMIGKSFVICRNCPAFIGNRLLLPYVNEAVYVLNEKIATKEDIDNTMKLGTNVKLGPLKIADLIGIDTTYGVLENMYLGFSDSKYRPCPLLKEYLDAGWLGMKTGKGFYTYKSK